MKKKITHLKIGGIVETTVMFTVHTSKIKPDSALEIIREFDGLSIGLKKEAIDKLKDYLIYEVLSEEIDVSFENMELSDIKLDGEFLVQIYFSQIKKIEKQNLCCLYECPNGLWLEFASVDELVKKDENVKKSLEIDLPNRRWRYVYPDNRIQSKDWSNIGEESRGEEKFVCVVFDPTDFTQLKNAFLIASHFYSNNDSRYSDD